MSEPLKTNHMWWGNHLEVAVHDPQIGRTFRVQFERSIDGLLKHSGGGGYRNNEEQRFEEAERVARHFAQSELGYTVIPRSEWSWTQATRGMAFRDEQELAKLSNEERRELADKLRRGEIELADNDE